MQFVLHQNHFDSLDGIETFLLDVEVIIDSWSNEQFQVRLFRKKSKEINDIPYFDFYLDILADPHDRSAFYMDSSTYIIRNLENAFVERIIDLEDELQICISHESQRKKKPGKILSCCSIVNDGKVYAKQLSIEPYDGPFSHLLRSLSFNDVFMGLPDFYDLIFDIESEFDDQEHLAYATQDDAYTFGATPTALPFIIQKYRPLFEAQYGFWIKVGCIRHKGFVRWTSGLEYALPQYFIVMKIKDKIHFKVFPIMKYMWIKQVDWKSMDALMITFDTTLFDPEAKLEQGKKEIMKVMINGDGVAVLEDNQ